MRKPPAPIFRDFGMNVSAELWVNEFLRHIAGTVKMAVKFPEKRFLLFAKEDGHAVFQKGELKLDAAHAGVKNVRIEIEGVVR